MASSYKNPPSLEEGKSYEQWKTEVNMWKRVTDLERRKRGLALALSLQGKAREIAVKINIDTLNVDDGVDNLIAELDKVFEKDKKDQAYSAYRAFDTYKRLDSVKMCDYIIQFEQNYNNCKGFQMTLPDAVLAFKMLDNAGLTESERQLALTACTSIKFEDMKTALNRIFGGKSSSDLSDTPVRVKEEVFVAQKGFGRGRSNQRSYNQRSREVTHDRRPKINPSYNGVVSRCRYCDSKLHWIKDCPHKNNDDANNVNIVDNGAVSCDNETVNITLFSAEDPLTPQKVFVIEAQNAAVIDTACTKTVCGTEWLHNFIDCLEIDHCNLTCESSHVPFKFGDGETVYSYQSVRIPARISDISCFIQTEVVDCKIPLLLSKESLKRAKTVLDLSNDRVTMFGKPVELHLTSTGHYCVNIVGGKTPGSRVNSEEILTVTSGMKVEDKKKTVVKLHRQFGHASSEKLIALLKSAGSVESDVKDIVNEVCSTCIICHRFKRAKPKPVVAFSLASDFNQVVALDLHEIDKNFWYLHIIDVFSRLSAATIVRKKDPEIIVDKFMQIWVGIYGCPEVGVYTDNGGEFNSQVFRDMAENLNMSVKTTAAYAPWSNGVVERHNATLTETLLKVKEQSNVSWETAISWAVNAKNCLLSVHGYSPYQIVYGRNPNLPSVLTNKPPALEGTTVCQAMGKHLTALYKARKSFIASESSEKVRRALRKQVRPSGDKFVTGDRVYFLRDNEWKGPGWVIGQDNVVVFVRYGGTYVRVHESRLLRELDAKARCGDGDWGK